MWQISPETKDMVGYQNPALGTAINWHYVLSWKATRLWGTLPLLGKYAGEMFYGIKCLAFPQEAHRHLHILC